MATPEPQPTGELPANAANSPDPVFQAGVRADADTLERVFESLIARYPTATVMVMRHDGILVAAPDSLPLRENPVAKARSGLDFVVQEDRLRLLDTWDRTLSGGAARCLVRLAERPEVTVAVHQLDLRERHGVVVVVVVPTDESVAGATNRVADVAPLKPRFASVRKDERSFFTHVDAAITEILGWSAEEMEGHRSLEFLHRDDHALAIDNWMEMLAAPGPGRRVRLRHRHRDGSWVWFEVTNHNLLDDPDHGCVISQIVDISEEMSAQEELRAREQLLDRLAEAIPMGLFQVDAERNVVYTNDRLHEIIGVERAASVETQLATVLDSDRPQLEKAVSQVLHDGLPGDIEVSLRRAADNELRLCSVNLRALSHDDGTISGAIACVADVTESANMRAELERRASFDQLTGCYNRASIMQTLESNLLDGSERAVMFVDLDRFKAVNDRYGHGAGDEMLAAIAARLRDAVRGEDVVGRIGGDEFLVLCPDIGGPQQAMALAARLTEALGEDVPLLAATVSHQISIGVAWVGGDEITADELVAQADTAMYESKHERAGRPQLAPSQARSPRRAPRARRAGAFG